jgi:hypothetical protein
LSSAGDIELFTILDLTVPIRTDTRNVFGKNGIRKRRTSRRNNEEIELDPQRKLTKKIRSADVSAAVLVTAPHRNRLQEYRTFTSLTEEMTNYIQIVMPMMHIIVLMKDSHQWAKAVMSTQQNVPFARKISLHSVLQHHILVSTYSVLSASTNGQRRKTSAQLIKRSLTS